jgi:ubiquinone/menaquinone biosynthesis C-methylase UbiE
LRWSSREHRPLDVTGLDISPQILEEAHRFVGDNPITLVLGDARALPWPDASFDVVTCLGVLHHFDEQEACRVLHEMWRVCKVGVVVVDLERSYPAYLLAQLGMHIVAHHPITRYDGLLSIMRSYTAPELRALAQAAGLSGAVVRCHPPFLQALVVRKVFQR